MPTINWFAYCWPNRRTDKTVVEITLEFTTSDQNRFPRNVAQIRDLLVAGNVLAGDDVFPAQALPKDRYAWYTSLLVQSALLFQQKAGHRVNFTSLACHPEQDRCVALMEHEHCDVGMTAVKLAIEMMNGERKLLAEPFRAFCTFAQERLLPKSTEAIIRAAKRRDIPVTHLERSPYKRRDFNELTGGKCICPNGLIMLGYGKHQRVLDGTWSLDLQEDLSAGLDDPDDAVQILDRLFPGGQTARMPIIAVTGTNGKTTTTRMISHIMQHSDKRPGMVCTDGTYLDGRLVEERDACTDTGHLQVLTSKNVDTAILETHHAGIMARGFCFDWCDIAVCLNVTEDHLGVGHINTVEQMAEVKQALIERARYAAVLNADDKYCLAMTDAVRADRLCLVSMESSPGELQEKAGRGSVCYCVLERIDGEEWLVIHDEGEHLPVMAVAQIPATFDGTARFNTSNAMHAVMAAYLAGIEPDVIRSAMGLFASSYQTTPGRMNVFDDLPFRIVMDFAHNPHGMSELCEFTDQQDVSGRKLIALSGTVDRVDETIRNMGRSVAGHFDFYFCKEYVYRKGKAPRKTAHLVREGLLDAGVPEDQIAVMGNGKDVIFGILDACKPGDLLVMLLGHVEKHQLPGYIEEYAGKLD